MAEPKRDNPAFFNAAFGAGEACPDWELLASAATRPEIQRHLDACSRCRTELALLRSFEQDEPRRAELASVEWIESELERRSAEVIADSAAPATRPSVWDRIRAAVFAPAYRPAFAIAAIVVLVVAAGSIYFRRGSETSVPYSGGQGTVWRSAQIAVLSPVGDLAAPPHEFRWEAIPGGATYRLELREVDGTALWTGDFPQDTVEIPKSVAGRLTPGRAFQWQVTARNSAGETISRSSLQNFRILPTTR